MATIGKWSGNTTSLLPTTSWAAPNALFPTQDRNDGSAYSFNSTTSTITLPSSNLANGYRFVARFEFEDTSNGRHNPQGKFVQASGTGNFVGGGSGGYNRDNSEDRSYVVCFGFVNNPSAGATFQFQWKRDVDTPTGGTLRSSIEVIPYFYSNIGMYTSSSAALYGGTTPNLVTGFSALHESDTAAIELVSNQITMKTDNKRYVSWGSQFFEGRGGRTQRWHGFRIDSVKEDAAKAYSYYRDTSNDENGDIFSWLIDRVTTDITLDQFCYRGDGVSALQGGADIDGSTPGVGDHVIVVLELNDTAEVFRSQSSSNSSNLATSPTDLNCNETTDFNDTASFTDLANTSINCVKSADYDFGVNVSAASNAVANTTRWTAYAELHINGTEDTDYFAGGYMRNNQGTQDTFGWSANLIGFLALLAGDDVGVSVTELSGSEGGGAPVSPAGWTGFWGINLDTLQGSSDIDLDVPATSIGFTTYTITNPIDVNVNLPYPFNAILLISDNVISLAADNEIHLADFGFTAYEITQTIDVNLTVPATAIGFTNYTVTLDIAGGDINLDVPATSIGFTSYVPELVIDIVLSVPATSIGFTTHTTTLDIDVGLIPPANAIGFTSYVPVVVIDIALTVPATSIGFTAHTATQDIDVGLPAPATSIGFTSYVPDLVIDVALDVPSTSIGFTDYTITVTTDNDLVLDVPLAVIGFTSYVPALVIDIALAVPATSIGFTAHTATQDIDVGLPAPATSIGFTSYVPELVIDVALDVPATSIGFTSYEPSVVTDNDLVLVVPFTAIGFTSYVPDLVIDVALDVPATSIGFTVYTITVNTPAGDLDLDVPHTSIGFTAYTATQDIDVGLPAPATSIGFTSYVPELAIDVGLDVPATSLGFTSYPLTQDISITLVTPAVGVGFTGYVPAVVLDVLLVAPATSLGFTPYIPDVFTLDAYTPDPDRTLTILLENRILGIPVENRNLIIPSDNRDLVPPADDRGTSVPSENRNLVIS